MAFVLSPSKNSGVLRHNQQMNPQPRLKGFNLLAILVVRLLSKHHKCVFRSQLSTSAEVKGES
jgi:hypothetical protein